MSKTGKVIKVAVIASAAVFGVAYFAGQDGTVTITHTAVSGTAWGGGVLLGAAKDVGPAFRAGLNAGSSNGSANLQTFTAAPPAVAAPKAKAKQKKTVAKVPNCTPKQKKAAPASCA